MRRFNIRSSTLIFVALFALSASALLHFLSGRMNFQEPESIQDTIAQRQLVSLNLGAHIERNELPELAPIIWNDQTIQGRVEYTLSHDLQAEATKLLKQYKPDYGAIFAMDATSGSVLVMTSFEKSPKGPINYNLIASFPAASLFKIVTAAAAIDKAGINPEHRIRYNGGAYTLYRRNVMTNRVNRWTNVISLKEAFARSINTAFGRISLEVLEPEDIAQYAEKFMFNQYIPTDFPVEEGIAIVPDEKNFELTEVASGYNRRNTISPVQGAMIAAAIANDGTMLVPHLVESIFDESGSPIYMANTISAGELFPPESARKLQELMKSTVVSGTSRRSFFPLIRNRKFQNVELGGKTGHLTGNKPKGRVDWFVGYAFDGDQKIAIAALTVSKEYWTVKSAHLAQTLIRSYFQNNLNVATTGQ